MRPTQCVFDAFSQDIQRHISSIEKKAANNGELKFGELPCNPSTGGLSAFAVHASASPPQPISKEEQTAPVECEVPIEPARFETSVYRQVDPSEIVENKLVVYDTEANVFRAIKIHPGQTVDNLIKAEQRISGQECKISTNHWQRTDHG